MSEAAKAVFLSYASQDAEVARKICDALRTAGLEVWFDQSDLRGGDAWDQKIRRQIKECALFVPVISTHTQDRLEGYFRLEWKLAEDRSHLMAKGKPFIVPVTSDATNERKAHVPDSFLAVQWTRLPGGEVPPAFVTRVRALLGVAEIEAGGPRPVQRDEGAAPPAVAARRRAFPVWRWAAAALAIALGAGALVTLRPFTKEAKFVEAQQRFLAVLPFANLSDDRGNTTVFAEGMHDEVITALGKVAALTVIGRTSVLPYADPKQRNLKKIAADLGIGTVVEGTVRRDGNKIRIAVELVEAKTSRQLWRDVYERELTDVFAIQAAIAQDIAARLDATLTAGERALLARRPTENPRAHELYLDAKLLYNDLTISAELKQWERATRILEAAVAADPGFAQAHALLSRIHSQIYGFPALDPFPARREQLARQALAAAQRLEPTMPETRLAEGRFALDCERDAAKALSICRPLLAELPNDDELIFLVGAAERQLAHYAEGATAMRRGLALNPRAVSKATSLITILMQLRHFAEAVEIGGRYNGSSAEYDGIILNAAIARYELDGDRARLARSRRENPIRRFDSSPSASAYESALIIGDLPGAARALSDDGLTTISMNFAKTDPVGLHRALIAHLLGRREDAAKHAAEATAYYLRLSTEPTREQRWVKVGLAMAAVCARQNAEALRLATGLRAEIARKMGHNEISLLNELGRAYALLGEREEALAILRTLMTGPNSFYIFGTPRLIRIDPCWSQLAADPRFDEILKAAKSL